MRPDDLTGLARGLLKLELDLARELSWKLPDTESFSEHAQLALSIGASGRRMSALASSVPIYSRTGLSERADGASSGEVSPPKETERWSALELYSDLSRFTSTVGSTAYDFKLTIDTCRAIADNAPGMLPLKKTDEKSMIRELLVLGNNSGSGIPKRSRLGNSEHRHDPRWKLALRGEVLSRMRRVETPQGLLHKLHHTAFRETVASEIAALNLLEYDNLPWEFYIDMARQAEDEARHSSMAADLFLSRGGKFDDFVLPTFGNYYSMFLGMTLTERLVTLNLDIEATGQGYLHDIATRLGKVNDLEASNTFSHIARDEQRHAGMGAYWLKYLYPDQGVRQDAINQSRAMTAINLAAAEAKETGGSALGALLRWIEGDWPVEYEERLDGFEYEPEITPLVARTKAIRQSGEPPSSFE